MYKNVSLLFCFQLIDLFRDFPGFVTCIINQICPGSIHVEYSVIVEQSSPIDRNDVFDRFYGNVDDEYFLSDSTIKLEPSGKLLHLNENGLLEV